MTDQTATSDQPMTDSTTTTQTNEPAAAATWNLLESGLSNVAPESQPSNTDTQQSFFDSLPEGLKNNPDYKQTLESISNKYGNDPGKAFEGLINAYNTVGRQQEGMIKVPGENANDDERQAFQQQLRQIHGAPESPEEYTPAVVKDQDGKEIEVDINGPNRDLVRNFLHKMGLGQEHYNEAVNLIIQTEQQQRQEGFEALTQKWGDQYNNNLGLAAYFIENHLPEDLRDAIKTNYGNDPVIIDFVYRMAEGIKKRPIPGDTGSNTTMTIEEVQEEGRSIRNKLSTEKMSDSEFNRLNNRLNELERLEFSIRKR